MASAAWRLHAQAFRGGRNRRRVGERNVVAVCCSLSDQ